MARPIVRAGGQAVNQIAAARRFSTDMFTPRDRLSAWRDFVGRAIFRLDIEPYADTFSAETVFRPLPGMGFVSGYTTASRHGRRPHMVNNDDILFSMPVAGTSRFTTFGREAVVGPGDAIWVGGGEAGFQETHGEFRFLCLQVPKRALRGAVANLEDTICRRIPAETPALRLLRLYADTLRSDDNVLRPEMQQVIASHARDLIAAALGATGHEAARSDGLRAAQLHAIKQDIETRLDQPDLSTATVAARHRMSPRQLQRLFETENLSVTAFILDLRLARAHRMLVDPRLAGRPVSLVACDAGFSHLSRFHTAFRARFGASPRDVRAQYLNRNRTAGNQAGMIDVAGRGA
jgi:AraC-like DNA-binding protein